MPRVARLAALALAALGCAHGPPSPEEAPTQAAEPSQAPRSTPATPGASTPPPAGAGRDAQIAAQLAAIRAEVDAYLSAQGKLLWEAWTRGAAPDLGPSMAAHPALFSRDTLLLVRAARDRAGGDERRALSLLHAFLMGEHLARAADGPASRAPAVLWDGDPVPTWRVPALLAAEPAASRRAALEHAWAEAERRRAGGAAARWDAIARAARALGYDSLPALAAELRGEPSGALTALAEGVLTATDATYRSVMDALSRVEMGKPWAELKGRDVPRLLRAGDDRRAFPAERAAPDALGTLSAVGLDLDGLAGVVIDGEARHGKDPRALALPIDVPGDVRVSYTPRGGAAELRGILHELGAAAFYAHVDTPVMEFRRLGTVTAEAWAGLFAELTGDPGWLAERTAAPQHEIAAVVRASAARRLHQARLLAAHLLDEVARARDPQRAAATARSRLERALGRPAGDDELQLFVLDRDPLLESADALRALLLAAQADAFLSARAPAAWWRSRESGAWLATAFAEGSRLAPSELARKLGAGAVDAAALVAATRARVSAAGLRLAQAGR